MFPSYSMLCDIDNWDNNVRLLIPNVLNASSHSVCRHWSIIIEWIPESVSPDKFEIVYENVIAVSFD